MYGIKLLWLSVFFASSYFLILPVFLYFRDAKGLRRYPGYSFLSGIYDIPYCRLSARGFRSKDLTGIHKDRPVVRIGPNNLSFGAVKAIRDIYGHNTTCVKDLKYVITAGEHPHLFDVVEKAKHGEKRKRLSAAFAIKHLVNWEFRVANTTQRLLTQLDSLCTPAPMPGEVLPQTADLTVDFNHWINLFTIEAINYLALSDTLGLLERGTDWTTAEKLDGTKYEAQYRKAQNTSARATSHFVWDYDNFRSLVWISKFVPKWRKIWQDASPWQDIIYHQASKRMQQHQKGEKLDDFFTALMYDKAGKPYNLEWGEIVGEVGAIIDAGADTTAIALTQILELLIRHPQHLKTLRKEVKTIMKPDQVVASYDAAKSLPFLKACLDEAMRIIPPTSAGLPRRTPPEGAEILGEWIPGNTSVSMPIYTAHHDPTIFLDPAAFNPHRWMDRDERKKMESYFIPCVNRWAKGDSNHVAATWSLKMTELTICSVPVLFLDIC
jgi:benzoate 4-monooxygenase